MSVSPMKPDDKSYTWPISWSFVLRIPSADIGMHTEVHHFIVSSKSLARVLDYIAKVILSPCLHGNRVQHLKTSFLAIV